MPYKDKAKRNEVKKRWIERNKEKQREYNRKFHKNNPEYTVERSRRRRATEKGNGAEFYTDQMVIDIYGTICYLCKEQIDMDAPRSTTASGWEMGLHIDHMTSIKNGGPDTLENVRPTHGICNIRKGGKNAEY